MNLEFLGTRMRVFERGRIRIECQPGRDIVIEKHNDHQRVRFGLTLSDAHFLLTRLQEAMRVASDDAS